MRSALLLVLVAAAALPSAPAHAAPGPGEGLLCGYTQSSVPLPDGHYAGEADAGPFVVADGADPRTGRIRCTIQLGGVRHSDPDTASMVSPTTAGVVVLPPTPYEYVAQPGDPIAYCTQVEIDGAGTFYFDETRSEWSADPDAWCGVGWVPFPMPGPDVDPLPGTMACPLLASVPVDAGVVRIGPDGDVVAGGETWWDCPPFEWYR